MHPNALFPTYALVICVDCLVIGQKQRLMPKLLPMKRAGGQERQKCIAGYLQEPSTRG